MRKDIEDWASNFEHKFFIADGFDDHILGMIDGSVAYSTKGIIETLISQGMTSDEAFEFFTFNIEGAKGEGFPVYVDDILLNKNNSCEKEDENKEEDES